MFHFLINENVNSPTISFVSEDPGLQYVSYCMYMQYSRCVFYTVRLASLIQHKQPTRVRNRSNFYILSLSELSCGWKMHRTG